MKFFLINLFLVILVSYIQSTGKKIISERSSEYDTNITTESLPKKYIKSVDSIYYVYKNGILAKTVLIDSTVNKARLVKTLVINNKFYFVYSRYKFQYPLIEDISIYYKGHFLNSYDLENMPAKIGDIFNASKLKSTDTEIELGFACSHDDIVEFEKVKILPDKDASFFIVTSVPICSDVYDLILIKKQNKQFIKLFNIESSDPRLKIKVQSDSIISFHNKLLTTDASEETDYIFNLRTNLLTEQ
jgi:hypothetical protein